MYHIGGKLILDQEVHYIFLKFCLLCSTSNWLSPAGGGTEEADSTLFLQNKSLDWRWWLGNRRENEVEICGTPVITTSEVLFFALPSLEEKIPGSLAFTNFTCPIAFHVILSLNVCQSRAPLWWADKLFTSLQLLSSVHPKCFFSFLDGIAFVFIALNHPSCFLLYLSKIMIPSHHLLLFE